MMKKAVCIISEDLSQPIDEGIKNFAHSLIQHWSKECDVLGISVRSPRHIDAPRTTSVKTNRLLLSYKLRAKIRHFRPDIICYVPSASATISSFLRSRVLKFNWPSARVVMVSLQPRYYNWVSRHLIRFLSPDIVFVQNEPTMIRLRSLGCHTKLLPSGVDLEKFTPVSAGRKAELRSRYGLNREAFTVLHVGHITKGRNIELLMQVCREHAAQVLLAGSSLRHEDRSVLAARLRGHGIIVLDEYFRNIEELYQLSDCYLFPVFSDQACIGIPLSILEAMACNLPVVTVRYGNLPALFEEGQGLVFADTPAELMQGITRAKRQNGCHTREKVIPYSWQRIARNVLDQTAIVEEKS